MTVTGGRGQGSALNQFSKPYGLFVDKDETICIADWGNHRILQWTRDATSVEWWPEAIGKKIILVS